MIILEDVTERKNYDGTLQMFICHQNVNSVVKFSLPIPCY